MVVLRIVALALTLTACVGTTADTERVRDVRGHHARISRKGYVVVGETDPEKKLHVVIAVKQQNADELEARLEHIATPGSDEYMKFMSNTEVVSRVRRQVLRTFVDILPLDSFFYYVRSYTIATERSCSAGRRINRCSEGMAVGAWRC